MEAKERGQKLFKGRLINTFQRRPCRVLKQTFLLRVSCGSRARGREQKHARLLSVAGIKLLLTWHVPWPLFRIIEGPDSLTVLLCTCTWIFRPFSILLAERCVTSWLCCYFLQHTFSPVEIFYSIFSPNTSVGQGWPRNTLQCICLLWNVVFITNEEEVWKEGLRALLAKPKGAENECFHTVLLLLVESQILQAIAIVNWIHLLLCAPARVAKMNGRGNDLMLKTVACRLQMWRNEAPDMVEERAGFIIVDTYCIMFLLRLWTRQLCLAIWLTSQPSGSSRHRDLYALLVTLYNKVHKSVSSCWGASREWIRNDLIVNESLMRNS